VSAGFDGVGVPAVDSLHATWVVALLIVRTWFNGLCRAVGSRRGGTVVVVAVGVLLLAWLILGTRALITGVAFDAADARALAGPVGAQLFALPALIALFAAISTPDRTRLGDLLAVLPVPAFARTAAPRCLLVVLGVLVGGAWAFPLAWAFVGPLPAGQAVAALVCCVLIALLGATASQAGYALVESVGRAILGASTSMVRGVGGAGIALVIGWMLLLALPLQGRLEGAGPLVLLTTPLRWTVDGPASAAAAVAVLGTGVVFALLVLAAGDLRLRRPPACARARWLRMRTPSARTLIGLDAAQWRRFPMNASFLVFNGVILAVVVLRARQTDPDTWFELAALFLALASTVGVGSFGATRAGHWMFNVAGRPRGWIMPKLAAAVLIWVIVLSTMALLFAMTTSWNIADSLALLPTLALELVVGLVVGLVIPVGREQSFGSAASEVVAVLVVLSVAVGIRALPWMSSTTGIVVTHFIGLAGALGLYLALAREHSSKPLVGVS
jgi:hypothetical protein